MATSPFVPHWTEAGKVPSADSTYQVPVEGLQITLSARESPDTCAPRATSPAVPQFTEARSGAPELGLTNQYPVDGRKIAKSAWPSPVKSPATGTSPAVPPTIATVPPPEKCTYQVPVDGRNSAMSVTPFPSKSPGTGMSPAGPHCTEGSDVPSAVRAYHVPLLGRHTAK